MAIEVEYRGETDRPAINVKVYGFTPGFDDLEVAIGEDRANDIYQAAYERLQAEFWQDAETMADESGLGDIYQAGRMGGWIEFTDGDPRDTSSLGHVIGGLALGDWLKAYAKMRAWAKGEVASAPARVMRLAQSCAMNAVGREAGIRHFGYLLDSGNGSTIMRDDGSTYHVRRSGWLERA